MTYDLQAGAAATDQFIDFAGTQGKYALLMVPDYDLVAADNQTSYASYGASSLPTESTYSVWARFRGTTKGIRVHTDGQLVTTTKENRLEVVGGNYEVHVRGVATPGDYPTDPAPLAANASAEARTADAATRQVATTFRNADEVYLRLGLHSGTPHLPEFLDDDAAKKSEIGRIITKITPATSTDGAVNQFAWEDHAGGHRVTTTKGDKLEIIKGKSYVHVLGADDFDVSEGQKSIARTGSDPQAPDFDSSQNGDKRPMTVERTWARRQISETWLGLNTSAPTSKLGTDENIQLTSFPEVIDGESREYTYGKKLSSFTGDADHRVDDIEETTYAHRINNLTNADAINEVTEVKGAIAETTLVPFMTSTQISLLLTEVYVGGHISVELGTGVSVQLGAYLEISSSKWEVEIERQTVTVGTTTTTKLGIKNEIEAKTVNASLDALIVKLRAAQLTLTDEQISGKTVITSASLSLGI